MFFKKFKSSSEKVLTKEQPLTEVKEVKKVKQKKESPKKSKVKNDSNIFFEMNKTKEIKEDDKPKSKPNGQPEHLRKALEARRARIAEEKAQGKAPVKKEKKKKEEKEEDSDSSLSSLDMNKIILKEKKKEDKKEVSKKYYSDSDSD
jgi:hypothetical protein